MEPRNYVGDNFARVTPIYKVTQYNIACCYSMLGQVRGWPCLAPEQIMAVRSEVPGSQGAIADSLSPGSCHCFAAASPPAASARSTQRHMEYHRALISALVPAYIPPPAS
jgi:hypothetical protein